MIRFCTFGSVPQYAAALESLRREAEGSGYFDEVVVYTQADLKIPQALLDWMGRTRGFGFWTWKTLIVLDMMARSAPDDIIVYADAGCGISTTEAARARWAIWLQTVREHPTHRLAFQMPHLEEVWTKGDVFEALGAVGNEAVTKTGQCIGGIQLYLNTPENQAFVRLVRDTCFSQKGHLVNDSPSRSPNAASFQGHRHDQSVRSVLLKLHGSAFQDDHWMDPAYPIVALRRRRG